jgi:excisionase family DNA binding protein
MRVENAADRLRVHRSYIYELINTGVLPHPIKLERAARFKASDLDEAIGALSIECSITKPHWISSMGRTARRRSSVNFHK